MMALQAKASKLESNAEKSNGNGSDRETQPKNNESETRNNPKGSEGFWFKVALKRSDRRPKYETARLTMDVRNMKRGRLIIPLNSKVMAQRWT